MWISEIFYSIQGEGELTGVPSVFIRTAGCNLRCGWCDTPYASWQPEGEKLDVEEIMRRVEAHPARHAVLTGGEPMIAPELPVLAALLRDRGWHITIETAGTVPPGEIACDLASISPKLASSAPTLEQAGPEWLARHERTRSQPEVLRAWLEQGPFQLKFVVTSFEDLAEIRAAVASIGVPVPPHRILLMPEGTDTHTLEQRQTWLVELCKREGFRYCDRLHVRLFGHTRGT